MGWLEHYFITCLSSIQAGAATQGPACISNRCTSLLGPALHMVFLPSPERLLS